MGGFSSGLLGLRIFLKLDVGDNIPGDLTSSNGAGDIIEASGLGDTLIACWDIGVVGFMLG